MLVGVIPNLTRRSAGAVTQALLRELARLEIAYLLPARLRQDFPSAPAGVFAEDDALYSACEVVLPVGGDGSVIRAAKQAALYGRRVLGVNAGRLAYLCGLDPETLPLLERLLTGDYTVQRRMMLRAELFRGNEKQREEFCVNDAAFCRGKNIGLIDLSVSADGKPIADYIADGVIFATPTGSTAYSLSAGGPIVEPTLNAVLLTAVCPHSLTFRPYLFGADTEFIVRGKKGQRTSDVCLSCDGEDSVDFPEDAWARITKADRYAEFISITNDNFIDVLNKKTKNWYGSENG